MIERKLDGVYFRINRDGEWQSICFSDLTKGEMNAVLEGKGEGWLRSLCVHLGCTIQKIGETFNL